MSKKYFGTDGIRGRVGDFPLTPDFILKLGWAAGKVLASAGNKKVVIGKDTRISGYMFESALEAGLIASGIEVFLLGPMPTPAVAYMTQSLRADAGIVISASHNPYYDNGIKFFNSHGQKLTDEQELAIEELVDQELETVNSEELGKAQRIDDASGRYMEFCKSVVDTDTSFEGLRLIVDSANGATYHIAAGLFSELGAQVTTIGDKPDGFNINKQCGATDVAALQSAVIEQGADLGVALDGDGDRLIMVDNNGAPVDGDALLYVLLQLYRDRGYTGGVVGTLMTNLGLELALKKQNVGFTRANVGDRYVLADMLENNWLLGGESSGHLICLDKATTGDGLVAALLVMEYLVKQQTSLAEVLSEVQVVPQILVNVTVANARAILGHPDYLAALEQGKKQLGEEGRILIRPSGTEPLIRVMVEGMSDQLNREVAQHIADVIRTLAESEIA